MSKIRFYAWCWLFLAGLAATPALADKIYKCQNQKGILIYGSSPCADGAESLADWTVVAKAKPPGKLSIQQDRSGHYTVGGQVNDQALTLVVDTGASMLSIPDTVARAARIDCGEAIKIQTANGEANACKGIIPTFSFGPFLLHDVIAVIAPNLSQPLLGMNILQRYSIEQDQGEMRIKERN